MTLQELRERFLQDVQGEAEAWFSTCDESILQCDTIEEASRNLCNSFGIDLVEATKDDL